MTYANAKAGQTVVDIVPGEPLLRVLRGGHAYRESHSRERELHIRWGAPAVAEATASLERR